MTPHLQRAVMLIEQSRYELAEQELNQALVQDPNDAMSHSLRAICLCQLKKFKEAEEASHVAIQMDPDSPYSFYAASIVSLARNNIRKAESEILHAIEIDPDDPDFFAQLASIKIMRKQWRETLEASEEGLAIDPENVRCTNLRAIALTKLGRKNDAASTIRSALEKSPEEADSHANMGWNFLERGKHKEAMPHFKEALRLEPNNEWARSGIVEAMKGQYFIYRIMLNWFLWSSKLDPRKMWAILIGGYIGYRVLISLSNQFPGLSPFLMPLIIAYIAFAVMTWISVPLFNLMLRLNRFGRLALSREEIRVSNGIGVCLLMAIAFVVAYFVFGNFTFLFCALGLGLMTPILGTYYASDEGWPRAVHGLGILFMSTFIVAIIVCALGYQFSGPRLAPGFQEILRNIGLPFCYIALGAQFGVGVLTSARPMLGTNTAKKVWIFGGLAYVAFAIGFIIYCANILTNYRPESLDLVSPIRIEFEAASDLDWQSKKQLDRLSAALELHSFVQTGDYKTKETESRSRHFLSDDGEVIAEIFQNVGSGNLGLEFCSVYEDGRVGLFGEATRGVRIPQTWTHTLLTGNADEYLQIIKTANGEFDNRVFKKDEVASVLQSLHTESMENLLEIGGIQWEDLRGVLGRNKDVTDETLHAFQELWEISAQQRIDEFVIKEFVEKNASYRQVESKLICVHRYSDYAALAKYVSKNQAGYLSEFSSERFPGHEEKKLRRAKYRDFADPQKLQRVGEVQKPIAVDIYQLK